MTAEQTNQKRSIGVHGEFRFKADAKGRVSLPASFRKVLPEDLVVTLSPAKECLYVYVPEDFEAWVDGVFVKKFGGYDDTDPNQAAVYRALNSRARDVQIDSAGRIMLPPEQRGETGIEKDVVIVGNGGRVEVWDAERYDAQNADALVAAFFGK
ncbi:MAG: division/cell wall cluster transcriptional repressor MraZ [Eggerthellaceae bacterium]|nr:division/cell wall cluster transcriptional repressor MraZ [Eggerthellaceae bacterium]